jgi:hypothetical protein
MDTVDTVWKLVALRQLLHGALRLGKTAADFRSALLQAGRGAKNATAVVIALLHPLRSSMSSTHHPTRNNSARRTTRKHLHL